MSQNLKQPNSALIIGYGSIGARHDDVLTKLGLRTAVLSRRAIDHPNRFTSLDNALISQNPGYVVIANRTSEHHETLLALQHLGYTGKILVEKPLFSTNESVPTALMDTVWVGYNLRFHPTLLRLRSLLFGQEICTFSAFVGQYLPTWRPGTDYRESYSANHAQGGGALLDLSHDIDYTTWLLGGWSRVTALGGKTSTLEITSDDAFSILLETPLCGVVQVHVNYLNRKPKREIIVNTADHCYVADLIKNTIEIDGEVEDYPIERNETYTSMHLNVIGPEPKLCCTAKEGLDLMRLLDAIRLSSSKHVWIES